MGAVWMVKWNNQYTQPPEGMPRVLAEYYYDDDDPRFNHLPEEVLAYYNRHNLTGSGYGIHWQAVRKPAKELPQEKLSSLRQKRLERRIAAKYPLFKEEFTRDEIEKKKDYYDGITDTEIQQERENVLKNEENRIRRLLEERVIIYWEGAK